MQEITIPEGCREYQDFLFVRISDGGAWRPALLEHWWLLPDGRRACRLRESGHKAVNGRTTRARTVVWDPRWIQPLKSTHIVQ